MAQHNELGKKGEQVAALYMKSKNYVIKYKNWRINRHEIDIVAENNECIVFVEVKTRTTKQWGHPSEFINNNKIRRIVNAADLYLKLNDIDKPARFDVISVVWNGTTYEIDHIEDAFMSPVF